MRHEVGPTIRALQLVMQGAGITLLQCQMFENHMVILLESLATIGALDTQGFTADAYLVLLNRHTAGQLAGRLQSHVHLDGLADLLPDAVDARNDLVHRFFNVPLAEMPHTPGACQSALDELDRIFKTVRAATDLLEPHTLGLVHCLTGDDMAALSEVFRARLMDD